ncbi:MAG: alpha/beta hydrolase [Chitinivibrionales bacterium]
MHKKILYLFIFQIIIFWGGCSVNRAFYFPDKKQYKTPADFDLAYRDIYFSSLDSTLLHGWIIPAKAKPSLATIVYYHGNAENVSSHIPFVSWLADSGFTVFMFDYRGYGKSEGRAGRRGIIHDSKAAVRKVSSLPETKDIIVFGQSLGGANAIVAVGSENIDDLKAVVIEGAFATYRDLVRRYINLSPGMGLLSHPFSWFVSDKYSPVDYVAQISPVPLLLIHGTRDQIIPYDHCTLLFENAGEPKYLWTVSNGNHLDTFIKHGEWFRPRLISFLKSALSDSAQIDPSFRNRSHTEK